MGMLDFYDDLEIEDNVTGYRASFLKWLDCSPEVYKGDARDNNHYGMLTKNLDYIVLVHMTEHNAIDHLPLTQAIALCTYLFNDLVQRSDRANRIKGSHLGVVANVTLQVPVRQYHCKYRHDIRWQHTDDRGYTLISDMDNDILIYTNGRIFIRTQEGNITEANN